MVTDTHHRTYRFNAFELRETEQCLLKSGVRVETQQKTIDLLLYLIRNRDRDIDKDELLEAVWGNTHLTDSAIARAVMKARAAVDDDGKQQSVIRTVHGKGLRFVAQVSESEATSPHLKSRSSAASRAAFAVVAIGVLLMAIFLLSSRQTGNDTVVQESDRITLVFASFENGTGKPEYDWLVNGLPRSVGDLLQESLPLTVIHSSELAEFDAEIDARALEFLGADFGIVATIRQRPEGFRLAYQLIELNGELTEVVLNKAEPGMLVADMARALLPAISDTEQMTLSLPARYSNSLVSGLYAQAQEMIYLGDTDKAASLLTAALAIEPDDTLLQLNLIEARSAQGDFSDAMAAYQALFSKAEFNGEDDATLSAILQKAGLAAWYQGDVPTARDHLGRALELIDDTEMLLTQGSILNSLSLAENSVGNLKQAWAHANRALSLFQQTGDDYHISLSLGNLGYMADEAGQISRAEDYHQQALAIRERYGFRSLVASSHYALARIMRRQGRFEQAHDYLDRCIPLFRELNQELYVFDGLEERAEILNREGRYSQAQEVMAEAVTIAEQTGDDLSMAWSQDVRGRLLALTGRPAEAIDLMKQSIVGQEELGELKEAIFVKLPLIRLYLDSGMHAEAVTLRNDVLAYPGHLTADAEAELAWTQAVIAVHENRLEQAEVLFREALAMTQESGSTDIQTEIALAFGHYLLQRGESAEARQMLVTANSWRENYHAALVLERDLYASTGDHESAELISRRLATEYPEILPQ